jgi:hypothetical protein
MSQDTYEDFEDVENVADDTTVVPDDEVETVAETKPEEVKPETKKSSRPPVPEGYITPVQFVKVLKEERNVEVAPQVLYSYVNQGKTSKGDQDKKLKSYSEGGRENLLKKEEALAWWDAKERRSQERAANKAAKAKADAEKPVTEAPVVETVVEDVE